RDTFLTPVTKKRLHELAAFVFHHAADDGESMIVAGQFAAEDRGCDRAGARFRCAVDERADARVNERADTHQAGLNRHNQRRASQTIVANCMRGLSDRDDFCVRGGIAGADGLIESASDDDVIERNDRADWYFASVTRETSLLERGFH